MNKSKLIERLTKIYLAFELQDMQNIDQSDYIETLEELNKVCKDLVKEKYSKERLSIINEE